MWQFVYSNAAPQDDFVNPPVPAQPEQGNLGTLMQAIDRGAPIRVGMLRSGTIRNSVFTVENVRYWKTEDDSQYVAIASLIIGSSNLNYDPTESAPGFGPWFNGVSVNIYHTRDSDCRQQRPRTLLDAWKPNTVDVSSAPCVSVVR